MARQRRAVAQGARVRVLHIVRGIDDGIPVRVHPGVIASVHSVDDGKVRIRTNGGFFVTADVRDLEVVR